MKNVLLIDSGSGGVNVLKECVKIVPHCNFLLFCDDLNLPYGSKAKDKLQEITLRNLNNIKSFFDFDIVILACNTLTSTCLEKCREVFPKVEFIGTVPAVKPALEKYKPEEVLVLATEATLKHNILINKNSKLLKKSMPNLASDIDAHLDEVEVLEKGLREEFVEYVKKSHIKAIVLGCTHYQSVQGVLQHIFGNDVEFFNSANGVARRLKHFVGDGENSYQMQIMVSGDENLLPKFFFHYQNLK